MTHRDATEPRTTHPETLTIDAPTGRTFVVRIIVKGDTYGLNHCLAAESAMVEFYDTKCAGKPGFDHLGQFVSRYELDTLMGVSEWCFPGSVHGGINLCGHVPVWRISGENRLDVCRWVLGVLGGDR